MKTYITRAGDATRTRIIKTALKLALKNGVNAIHEAEIAKKMKIDRSGIYYYFPDRKLLMEEVIKRAIESEELFIIAQVIVLQLPQRNLIKKSLGRKALLSCFNFDLSASYSHE